MRTFWVRRRCPCGCRARARKKGLGLEVREWVRLGIDRCLGQGGKSTRWLSFFHLDSRVEPLTGDLRHVRYEVQRQQISNVHDLTQNNIQSVCWYGQPQHPLHIPQCRSNRDITNRAAITKTLSSRVCVSGGYCFGSREPFGPSDVRLGW